MKRLFLMIMLGMLVGVSACTSVTEIENPAEDVKPEKVVIKATHELDFQTKTVLQENGDVWWTPDEAISVFFGNHRCTFYACNMEDAPSAYFVGEALILQGKTENSDGTASMPAYWGVCPYDRSIDDHYGLPAREKESVTVYLPKSQQGVSGTFDPDAFISIARSNDYKELSFYNLCGGLAFCVEKEGIHTVTFKGNAGETLAGEVNVVMGSDGYPVVNEVRSSQTEVTLTMDDGWEREYFVPGEWYYIVMLPTALEEGYTMEFHTDTEVGTLVSSKPVEIKRSVFGRLTKPDLDANRAIDLGLSVKWASCNLGASSPSEFGNYYSWGETTPYDYSREYNGVGVFGGSGESVLDAKDDAASVSLGGTWRIPTAEEWSELSDNCDFVWTLIDGVYGYVVYSRIDGFESSNIFLPAAGFWSYGNYYPASTIFEGDNYGDYITSSFSMREFHFTETMRELDSWNIYDGRTIRPVCD